MISRKYIYRPIKLIIAFNLLTLLLFIFGAWNYQVTNMGTVVLVVISCNFALYLGYLFAGQRNRYTYSETKYSFDENELIDLLYKWSIIGALIALPDMLYYSRMWTMSFTQILQRLVIAFTHSNLNYSLSLGYEDSGTLLERIVVLIDVFLYFYKFSVLPLSVIFWKKVSGKQKFLCIYITLLDVIKWLLKGMNKGLFDVAISFVAAMLISFAMNANNPNNFEARFRRVLKRHKRKLVFLSSLIVAAAVMVFISNGNARSSGSSLSYYSTAMNLSADRNNFLLRLIPKELHSAALSIDMYLTNGYQGLSYGLRIPFQWCYGLGNNQFLISNFRDVFGIDVTNLSYLSRIEKEFPWTAAHNWHSLYTWLANDVSFFFVPVVFFAYGYIMCKAWIDSIRRRNPYAIVVVCLFFIRFAYTSANNQVTSSSFSFIAWYFSIIMWYLSNRGVKVKLGNRIL